nr:hypothetical protein Itr_chr10CG15210 [Ipomoea trifida]
MAGRWTPSKQSAGFTATCTRSSAIAAAWRTVQEEGDVGYRGKSPEGEQRRCRSFASPYVADHHTPCAAACPREGKGNHFANIYGCAKLVGGTSRGKRRSSPVARSSEVRSCEMPLPPSTSEKGSCLLELLTSDGGGKSLMKPLPP